MQDNPNSLANLKLPKKKRENYGYRYTIPQEKIDELFAYLADGLSLKKSANKAGICFETARKYHRQGDAKRGIQPLVKRLEVFHNKKSEQVNALVDEQRLERLATIRAAIQKAQESIFTPKKFFNKDGVEIEVFDAYGKQIESFDFYNISIRDLERLIKLESFLCGGFTKPVEEKTMLSAEEISGGM